MPLSPRKQIDYEAGEYHFTRADLYGPEDNCYTEAKESRNDQPVGSI